MLRHDPRASISLSLLGAVVSLSACVGAEPSRGDTSDRVDPSELPVIQVLLGEYDGHELTIRTLDEAELDAVLGRGAERAEGVVSAPLVDVPSTSCVTCTRTDAVAFSTVAGSRRAITNGAAQGTVTLWRAADVASCGPIPTTGACSQVRLRNLFPNQIERAYAELLTLEPTGMTTSVSVPAQPFAATADFGVAPAIPNGLWRFGELGRSQPEGTGATTWWSFVGDTPEGSEFTFRFLVQVRGIFVDETQRANLADGELDDPAADYPARSSGSAVSTSSVALSGNARYVAFVTSDPALAGSAGNFLVRKDLSDGSLDVVNATSCTQIANPHLSSDGARVVFEAFGCDLTGEGSVSNVYQIYLTDFTAGTTRLVSRNTSGRYPRASSLNARISADGTTVVFQSSANDLVAGHPGRTGCYEIYRYDVAASSTLHVSAVRGSALGTPGAGWTPACTGRAEAGQTPDVSGDGSLIVFASGQPLDPSDTYSGRDIYVYDYAASSASGAATLYRVSVTASGGDQDAPALPFPSISADGAFVTFESNANNLAATTANRRHVYRRGTAEGDDASIELVTRRVDDSEVIGNTLGNPEISDSGRFVAFWSSARDLTSDGGFRAPLGLYQVNVCDMDAPVAPLARCWTVSTFQPTPASAFLPLGGVSNIGTGPRIGLAYPDDDDAGYVAYIASPDNWDAIGGAGGVYVSPVGDPRYQQATVSP